MIQGTNIRRRVRAIASFGLLVFAASFARSSAETVNIQPLSLTLRAASPSDVVTLENRGTSAVRFEVTGFVWNESSSGGMLLTKADDLIFFPTMLTIEPGARRTVRVGLSGIHAATLERTYRVFFEELPSTAAIEAGQSAIAVRTRFGVPVFVTPTVRPRTALRIAGGTFAAGKYAFDLVNDGNVHVIPSTVVVSARDDKGGLVAERNLQSWYLLAGGDRIFELPLTADECARVRDLRVRVNFETQPSFTSELATPKSCS